MFSGYIIAHVRWLIEQICRYITNIHGLLILARSAVSHREYLLTAALLKFPDSII